MIRLLWIFITSLILTFSLREHVEYKDGVRKTQDEQAAALLERLNIKTFDNWRDQFRHEIDRIETVLRDMHNELAQRVESREMEKTAQAKHDELKRLIDRMQHQLDELQRRINGK